MKSCAWAARAARDGLLRPRFGLTIDEVVVDRAAEQKGLLQHHADVTPQVARGQRTHVEAVQEHAARVNVVEPADQVDERRLAAPAAPDDADLFAGPDREIDLLEHRPMTLVAKRHVFKPDLTLSLRQRLGMGGVACLGRRVEQLENPVTAGHEAGEPGRELRQRGQRSIKHGEIREERHQ